MAGKVATCPVCGLRVKVPLPLKPESVEGDLLDDETGAVVKDWRAEAPKPPPTEIEYEEPEDEEEEDERSGERCYDCGRQIYESELVRRDVEVGSSYIPSDGDPRHHGRFVSTYGRVYLCRRCNNARDEHNKQVALGCFFLLAIGGLIVTCGGLFGR